MNKESINNRKFIIRPAARHVFTIGEGLIKDSYSAIVELVKNSFDADAEKVKIYFTSIQSSSEKQLKIIITDDGHGMTYDVVTNIWMVPSTTDKVERRFSLYKKRPLQGRKGIGRYAVAILGSELLMETTSEKITTALLINWDQYLNPSIKYLDEIEILIESKQSDKKNGTLFEVIGSEKKLEEWDQWQIDSLIMELRKLLSPVHLEIIKDFEIELVFENFPIGKYNNKAIKIEPFPIVDLYDYRISGSVDERGAAVLTFENKSQPAIPDEIIEISGIALQKENKYSGNILIDFRVFDRDPEAIEKLINRGLKDPTSGNLLGKMEARNLLNSVNGIGIYRQGFRVRPYGDPNYDWLSLDKARVQDPSFYIGSNQVIGFIQIDDEENSHLIEKSSREGLREDKYYYGLVDIAQSVINELQKRRFAYRKLTGRSRSKRKIASKLDEIIDFSDLKSSLQKELKKSGLDDSSSIKITNLIDTKLSESSQLIENVKEAIADYQGQATLGSILKVVLHEGNNPLSFMSRTIPLIEEWIIELKREPSEPLLDKIINRLNLFKEQAQIFINLFNRLNPLAAGRRKKPENFLLIDIISQAVNVLEYKLNHEKIHTRISCSNTIIINGWPEDFIVTFINLIDNSIYWLSSNNKVDKAILINISEEIEESTNIKQTIIEYRDNGPGIEKKFIEDESIFEPGFTSKPAGLGHGLGLAISGEAMSRNNGRLSAIYDPNGVYFVIIIKK